MLKSLLTYRTYICVMVFAVLCVGGMSYLKPVERKTVGDRVGRKEGIQARNEKLLTPLKQDGTGNAVAEEKSGLQSRHPHDRLSEAEHQQWHAALRAEKAAERANIREAGRLLLSDLETVMATYADVYNMRPEKFLAMTDAEQDDFLRRAGEFDSEMAAVKEILSQPHLSGILEERYGERYTRFMGLPSFLELYLSVVEYGR